MKKIDFPVKSIMAMKCVKTSIMVGILFSTTFLNGQSKEKDEIGLTFEAVKLIEANNDDEMIFFLINNRTTSFKTTYFNSDKNMIIAGNTPNDNISLGVFKDPPLIVESAPYSKNIWSNIIFKNNRRIQRFRNEFVNIGWYCGEIGKKTHGNVIFYMWGAELHNEKNPVPDFRSQYDQKDALNFKIAKLLDGKCLSFAFIASNNTSTAATLPGFHSSSNRLKVKFPDGKTFVYQPSATAKDLTLSPGKSEFVKFDLEDLLSQTKEFSMDNFNYGISELIWEIELPDKTVVTRQFKLLKTKNPLPPEAKTGKGYIMDINTPLQ